MMGVVHHAYGGSVICVGEILSMCGRMFATCTGGITFHGLQLERR